MKHLIHYQTTDLELRAPVELAPLADALTHQGLFTYHVGLRPDGLWAAHFTTAYWIPEPDQGIVAMLTVIEGLNEAARSLWEACTMRDFNVRYECGDEPWSFNQKLLATTLARIAAAGANLDITIYRVTEIDAVDAAVAILKKDKQVKSHIGPYKSLGIHPTDSFLARQTQVEVKVTLVGKKGAMYVHCLMESAWGGEWSLKEILTKEERPLFPSTEHE